MTDPIQNAMKKLRKLIDEKEADAEKYYQLESPEAVNHCKTMALAYKIALSKLEEEIMKCSVCGRIALITNTGIDYCFGSHPPKEDMK